MASRVTQYELEQRRLSKRIAKGLLLFWGFYRLSTLAVSLWRPEIIDGLTALTAGVDDLASVVVISYLAHSGSENLVGRYLEVKSGERSKLFGGLSRGKQEDEEDEESNG